MKKIVLACFWVRESNCGDKSYVETFKRLIDTYTEDVQVEICDFYARKPKLPEDEQTAQSKPDANVSALTRIKRAVLKAIVPQKILTSIVESERHKRKKKYARIKKYYREKLKGADALIVPGGGLVEYSSWRDYYYLLEMLEKICNEMRIDMYINSVGYVENEAPKKWFRRWKKIINNKCVKHFTCRDNLSFFTQLYPQTVQIPCAACLSSRAFGLSADETSNTIGIGLMRHDAYEDYGNDVSKAFLLNYYKAVIEDIISRGYRVNLFSVGVLRDHYFGEELMEYIARDDVVLLERPLDVETFLNQVRSFRAILTVRTHSAYAAFSLNVPAVMIYFGTRGWSGKSSEFMSMMGRSENAVCCDNVSPEELVDRLESAMQKGWDSEHRAKMMDECLCNFFEIMRKIGVLKADAQ